MTTSRRRIVGLGAGGHAKVVIDVLRGSPDLDIVGLLDRCPDLHGSSLLGVPILGDDSRLPALVQQGVSGVFIGVGAIGSTRTRRLLYELARRLDLDVVSAVHNRAIVSELASIGAGPTILGGAVINAGASLGANVLINTGAIVEHDVAIGDHVHIASGARLGGAVTVGDGAHVGLGAVVRQGIRIGASALVGAGAVVVDDVPESVVVRGVPARVVRAVQEP